MSLKITKKIIKILILNLGLMAFILAGSVWVFFKFGLPVITKHGQTITVPDLKGIQVDEMKNILTARHLRYKITEDIIYLPSYPPSVVLEQYPRAGARVKEGRSIYITLNAKTPPEVLMPNLVDGSVRNAYITLKSRGLSYNTITYVKDIAKNAILEQCYKGYPIAPGTRIAQGAKIDLIVGGGLDQHTVIVPDLIDMNAEEAELLLLDIGLCIGNITYEHIDNLSPGTVFRQQPKVGSELNVGNGINVWVVEANPKAIDMETEVDQPIIEAPSEPQNIIPEDSNSETTSYGETETPSNSDSLQNVTEENSNNPDAVETTPEVQQSTTANDATLATTPSESNTEENNPTSEEVTSEIKQAN
jgi:beta-lactam-binding protein with PASTA domain